MQEAIENFTSEALAIAIEHDDTPMVRALNAIAWQDPTSPPFDAPSVTRVQAHPQRHLVPFEDVRVGYLDLVLDLTFATGERATAWVEAKVDSPEHGDQFEVYARHALREDARAIFTLSRTPVVPAGRHPQGFDIGWLSWKDLAAAIAQSPDADERWRDLLAFLEEEGIAWRPLPQTLADLMPHVGVLVEVNRQIRTRWPQGAMDWVGTDPAKLRKFAIEEVARSGRLTATGGPLTYGLVPVGTEWSWHLGVGNADYHGISLDPDELAEKADRARFSDQWRRSREPHAMLELDATLKSLPSHEQATAWFGAALDEVKAAGILDGYLAKVAVRLSGGTDASPALPNAPERDRF